MTDTSQDIINYYTPMLRDANNEILCVQCKYDGLIPDGDQNYLDRLQSDASYYSVQIQKAENDLLKLRMSKLIDAVVESRVEATVVTGDAYMLALELKAEIES